MANKGWSSTAPPGEFHPYVESSESLAEFTIRAVLLGAFFGIIFGAVSVYVGLRAGLTVSASIPIAVLSVSILRAFGRATILEREIVVLEDERDIDHGLGEHAQRLVEQLFSGLVAIEDDDRGALQVIS